MGARIALAYGAKVASKQVLFYMGLLALLPAIGFAYLFVSGARTTGAEVFGDKIWWNALRPLHALLYALFAWYAIHGKAHAWQFLAMDALVGLVSFLAFHASHGSFNRI